MQRALASGILGLVLGCAAALAQPAAPAVPARVLDPARVEAFLSGAIESEMESRRVAGAPIAIIAREGVVFTRGYGRARPDAPADANTLFRVGSISKTPTWIALTQLAEEGRLKLDDPINDHLPPALQIEPQGFDAPILVRHLMTHTPGFEDSALGHLFVRDPARLMPMETYLQRYRVRRVRPPGEVSVYSNYGATLAGAIVAHEIGSDWPSYVETRILRPLGMATATYREPYPGDLARAHRLPESMPEALAARISDGWRMKDGQLEPAPYEYITEVAPAGAMSASANDIAHYMRALLEPGVMTQKGVLHEQEARTLSRPMFANDERLGAWRSGFMTFDLAAGRWAYGHGGDTIYQHALMVVSPDLGFGFFAVVNTASGQPALFSLLRAFVEAYYPIALTEERNEAAGAQSKTYAGLYRSLRRPYFRTERGLLELIGVQPVVALPDGDILLPAGAESRRFMPLGDGLYRAVDGPQRIAFREIDGRLRLMDTLGLAPLDRIGYFEGPNFFFLSLSLALIVCVWGVSAGLRRLVLGQSTRASLLFDGLCVIWLIAIGLFAAATLPWLGPDQQEIVFSYPGAVFPIACWTLALAAIATILVPITALAWARPAWGSLRWARAGAGTATFAVLALALLLHGLLGYSHF